MFAKSGFGFLAFFSALGLLFGGNRRGSTGFYGIDDELRFD
jgi:hypothetical protein